MCIRDSASGGGMLNYANQPTVTNCVFRGNTASSDTYGGGGMWNHGSMATVSNCTFSGNSAEAIGGGIYNYDTSDTTLTNCILWGNTPEAIYNDITSSSTITYSDVEGGYLGAGNIDADPNFVDANGGDLHLLSESPCIDAGDTTAVNLPLDLDGNPRAIDSPNTPNTGLSVSDSLHVVDMGAYEFNCDYTHGDINCDGKVDIKDFAILAGNWLEGV